MNAKLLFIFSMLVFGTVGLPVKLLPLESSEIALYRALLAFGALFIYQMIRGKPMPQEQRRKAMPLMLITGAVMGINWVFLFEAYRHTSISVATLCYYMAALIVTAISPLVFKEKTHRFQLFCFAGSLVGLVLIVGTDTGTGSNHTLGVVYGLIAAVLYATVITLNKLLPGVDGLQRTLWQFLGAIGVLVPYALIKGSWQLGRLDLAGWALLLLLGLFHTGFTYFCYFTSMQGLRGQEIALLSFLDPLVALIVSAVVLREAISPLQILGGLMILVFSYLSERRPSLLKPRQNGGAS